MKAIRLAFLATATAAALAAAVPADAQIQNNWNEVGGGTRVPGYVDDVDAFDYSGGGLTDLLLSGPGEVPGVLVDMDLGQPEQVWRLNQLGSVGRAEPGDLNRDGVYDVVAVVPQPVGGQYVVRYLLSTGSRSPTRGRYSVSETAVGGTSPSDVALADREGDGDLDAFVALPNTVAILNNPGTGRLALAGYMGQSGLPPARIRAGYLTPNSLYGGFVPPTLMVQLGDNRSSVAYVPNGGQSWRTIAIQSSALPAFAGADETISHDGGQARISGWTGNAFVGRNALSARYEGSAYCSQTAAGDHLVNLMSRTYAASVSFTVGSAFTSYVGLWGKPLTTGQMTEVRRILLPLTAGAACDLEFAELGADESGAPQHLVVLTKGAAIGASNLFAFRPSSGGGTGARSGAAAPAARLVGRRAKVGADGRFALRFRCPAAVRGRAPQCGSRLALRASSGAVTPANATVLVRPGATRSVRLRLSGDGVAAIRRARVTLTVRPVEQLRGKVVTLVR